jgi:hypothetical protein
MFRTRIEFRNTRQMPLTVWFEPWAEKVSLEHDGLLRIESMSNQDEPLSVEVDDNAIVVFGMPGCVSMKAFRDGQQVWESYSALPPVAK